MDLNLGGFKYKIKLKGKERREEKKGGRGGRKE